MKKEQLLDILSEVGDNEEIAVPIIWTKADTEQLFDVALTDDEWADVVDTYTNGDYHDTEAMESAVEAHYKAQDLDNSNYNN